MATPIYFASRFRKTWKNLDERLKEGVIEVILNLPDLQANPHRHTGFGFRNLRGTPFYETRLDLRWRLVLRITKVEIILVDVLNHDQVRRLGK